MLSCTDETATTLLYTNGTGLELTTPAGIRGGLSNMNPGQLDLS